MAIMYAKGIVVIPKSMREAVGIEPGSQISMQLENGKITIGSEDDAYQRWHLEFQKAIADANMSDEELERTMRITEKKRKERMLHVP
ncbi:MAG: AbrB/MazE/SpoVT family DNA-binding domain-containing protein [Candidatus Micrarchaeota archaeon]